MIFLIIFLLGILGAPLFIIIGSLAFHLFPKMDIPPTTMMIQAVSVLTNPVLLAIPFFTLTGYLMAESKSPTRIVNLANACLGWLPGGIAVVTLCACAFFTAFTGASGVTIIALGGLLYPILIKENYPEKFTLGLLTTCGSLGLLFPPSLPIILYGIVSNTDIDKIFIAGILPGLLLVILLSGYSGIVWKKSKISKIPFKLTNILKAVKEAIWEIPIPFIVIGGIYGGIFTAIEASIVIAVYVFIIEVLIYRDLHIIKDIPRIFKDSMVLVGGILIILGSAMGFTNFLIDAEVPDKIFNFMQQYITSQWLFLIVLNIFLLIVGCLMDIFSAIVVVVPLIIPIALQFGVDPIHLGIIFLTNLEIGYSTPPVGINLFIASLRFEKSMLLIYSASIRYIILLLIALIIITYFPNLSLSLVNLIK